MDCRGWMDASGRAHARRRFALWWRGEPVDRLSDAYQALLDRAYDALFAQSKKFRVALAASGNARLIHTIGKTDPCETILTVDELCSRLERIREKGRGADSRNHDYYTRAFKVSRQPVLTGDKTAVFTATAAANKAAEFPACSAASAPCSHDRRLRPRHDPGPSFVHGRAGFVHGRAGSGYFWLARRPRPD